MFHFNLFYSRSTGMFENFQFRSFVFWDKSIFIFANPVLVILMLSFWEK